MSAFVRYVTYMTLPPPRDNQWLFLDMNAYFASCEQHRHEYLRGQPVGVTPTMSEAGCIVAASYEAKHLGVSTGWRVGDAKRAIPRIHIVPADPKYYVSIHHQIHYFLMTEISPDVRVLSVDEFAIPLDRREQATPIAHSLALKVKQRMEEIFSPFLTCSIGIGPNMFLAKLGTEIHKPNGLTLIQYHTLDEAYRLIQLRGIPGINRGMSKRLHTLGIQTALDFYRAPQSLLADAFGIMGHAWWHNLRGYNLDVPGNFRPRDIPKTISHSHVLAPKYRTKAAARPILYKLCLKVAERLRDKGMSATNIVATARGTCWSATVTLRPTDDIFILFRALAQSYDQTWDGCPTQLYVVVSGLQPTLTTTQPLGFFNEDTRKPSQLADAIDTINARYGRWKIQPASLLSVRETAPNRITFRRPDFEMDEMIQ